MKSILRFNDVVQTYVTRLNYHFVYKKYMKLNGFKNTRVLGEDKWIERWSGLGIKPNPIYYRFFSKYIGNDFNIMPEDIGHLVIEKYLNKDCYLGYYEDKNMFDKILPQNFTPRTLIRRINGFFFDESYAPIHHTDSDVITILNTSTTNKIIIKPSVGTCSGVGIELLCRDSNCWRIGNSETIFSLAWLDSCYNSDFIIQEVVCQSDYMSQFNNTSVNTIRMSVYRSVIDNKPHVTSAVLRVGKKGFFVDNAHAGGLFCGIKLNGELCHKVLNIYGQEQEIFNDVNYRDNYVIPNYERIKEFAKKVAEYIPHHRLLALDIAIDNNDNPILLEYNVGGYGMWVFQLTLMSALGDYTEEIINYCREQLRKK